jgi:TRAP-type C4-dicarboxylate transport system substrate-binding protein
MCKTTSLKTHIFILAGCLLFTNLAQAKTTLKLSHNQDKSHAVHKSHDLPG